MAEYVAGFDLVTLGYTQQTLVSTKKKLLFNLFCSLKSVSDLLPNSLYYSVV